MKYIPTIGLEIHAELKTKSKMFCSCKNDPDEKRPNTNICPVCMGHPGTLPVLNKEAIKHVLKIGIACGSDIADFTEWDRKHYFYPDIPKGYQISQYKYPLILGGSINDVKITRIHLEEDTARSQHEGREYSVVDFNRSGLPLMELVTEPVIKSGEEASRFAKELQLLLRYMGAGEANMEKGEMRVEANISVSKDSKTFGKKVEVKNLNSFKAVEKAINYEIERHSALLDLGEEIKQETRGWDDSSGKTFSQRLKEDSHDYRYFPEPDIPKMKISEVDEFSKKSLIIEMGETPWDKRKRYEKDFGIKKEDIEIFVSDPELADFFEKSISFAGENKENIKLISNYIVSDLLGIIKIEKISSLKELKISPESFAEIIIMVTSGELSSRGAKDLLLILSKDGGDPKIVAQNNKLIQKSDKESIIKIVREVISKNEKVVEEYKSGKTASLQFLLGQGMKISKGSANPSVLKEIFIDLLK